MDIDKIKAFIVEQKKYVIGIVIVIVFLGMHWNSKDEKEDFINDANTNTQLNSKTSSETMVSSSLSNTNKEQASEVTCDISGAVRHEGVYTLKNGARIQELIEAAGGLKANAQTKVINRVIMLKDQDKVYIPYKGEKVASAVTNTNNDNQTTSSTAKSEASPTVNINTATVAELQKLNGIGQKRAEQIIAYREQNGNFKKIEDIMQVSGIGEKTFAGFKDQLAI